MNQRGAPQPSNGPASIHADISSPVNQGPKLSTLQLPAGRATADPIVAAGPAGEQEVPDHFDEGAGTQASALPGAATCAEEESPGGDGVVDKVEAAKPAL